MASWSVELLPPPPEPPPKGFEVWIRVLVAVDAAGIAEEADAEDAAVDAEAVGLAAANGDDGEDAAVETKADDLTNRERAEEADEGCRTPWRSTWARQPVLSIPRTTRRQQAIARSLLFGNVWLFRCPTCLGMVG